MAQELKERIIEEAIRLLRVDGLKFSVDELCEQLKISKKTLYKVFETKEQLAAALYQSIYAQLALEADRLMMVSDATEKELTSFFELLCEAYYFSDASMLNRYALGKTLESFMKQQNDSLENKLSAFMKNRVQLKETADGEGIRLVCLTLAAISRRSDKAALTKALTRLLWRK